MAVNICKTCQGLPQDLRMTSICILIFDTLGAAPTSFFLFVASMADTLSRMTGRPHKLPPPLTESGRYTRRVIILDIYENVRGDLHTLLVYRHP